MKCLCVLLQLLHQFVDHLLRPVVNRCVHLLAHEVGEFLLVRERVYLVYSSSNTALNIWHHRLQLFRLTDCLYTEQSCTNHVLRYGWLRSTVGRTPVSGRRTDPALRSACSRRVTTMWVNRPLQPTRPTQPFILPGSIKSSKAHKMSSTSFQWRRLVNACEVGPPDRIVSSTWRPFVSGSLQSGLNLVVACPA